MYVFILLAPLRRGSDQAAATWSVPASGEATDMPRANRSESKEAARTARTPAATKNTHAGPETSELHVQRPALPTPRVRALGVVVTGLLPHEILLRSPPIDPHEGRQHRREVP